MRINHVVLALLSLTFFSSLPARGEIVRASVTSTGGELSSTSAGGRISGNGRYIGFSSDADELGVSGSADQSFLYDTVTGNVIKVSFNYGGGQPDDPVMGPRPNYDGSKVVYHSYATDIVPNHVPTLNGGNGQVYQWSADTNQIVRVSETASGTQANGRSVGPTLNADGNMVAFQSDATNLVANDTNGVRDIFLKNMQDGSIKRISLGASGTEANGDSSNAAISADGRIVAFSSDATNLVTDANNASDVFVYEDYTQTVSRVSISSSGVEANGNSWALDVSANGRYVVFSSDATNLVSGDTEGYRDIFVHDRVDGTTVRVSETAAGVGFAGSNMSASVSADGRYVAFDSTSSSDREVPGGGKDVYRKDVETGAVRQWSIGLDDTSYRTSLNPKISAAGDRILFTSETDNLVANDTNAAYDVFYATDPSVTCTAN